MDLIYGRYQNGFPAVVAKAAIVVGVLGAVFYAGFLTASTGLPTFNHADEVPPASTSNSVSLQGDAAPQEAWSYFPANYVNQGKNEDGNVMTYEHD